MVMSISSMSFGSYLPPYLHPPLRSDDSAVSAFRMRRVHKEEAMRKRIISFCAYRTASPFVETPGKIDRYQAFCLREFQDLRPMEQMRVLSAISTNAYFLLFRRCLSSSMNQQYMNIAQDLILTKGYRNTKTSDIIANYIARLASNPTERAIEKALIEEEQAQIREKALEIFRIENEKRALEHDMRVFEQAIQEAPAKLRVLEQAIEKATAEKAALEQAQKNKEKATEV